MFFERVGVPQNRWVFEQFHNRWEALRPVKLPEDQTRLQRRHLRHSIIKKALDWEVICTKHNINGEKKLIALFDLQRIAPAFSQQIREFGVVTLDLVKNASETVYVILGSPKLWSLILDLRSLKRENNVTSIGWSLAIPSSLVKILEDDSVLVIGLRIETIAQVMSNQGISIRPIYDIGQMYRENEERWVGKKKQAPRSTSSKWIASRFYGSIYGPELTLNSKWFYAWYEPLTASQWQYLNTEAMIPYSVLFR